MSPKSNIVPLAIRPSEVSLTALFKALGDELRINILRVLKEGSLSVTELCHIFELGQSALSHHLKVMVKANLLTRRREGTVTFYRRQLADGDHGTLINEALHQVDFAPLSQVLTEGMAKVQKLREQNSLAFFQDNGHRFREQQELIASWEDYRQATLHLLDRQTKQPLPCVLELGPGDGSLLADLSKRAVTVVALDNSAAMLERAKVKAAEAKNIRFNLGEASLLIRQQQHFDAVIANMVLHHTPNPEATFRDAAQLVGAGGILIISELCPHDQDWAREVCGDLWLGFEPAALTRWAGQAGLQSQAELFIAQRNGFQIQVRLFQRPTL
ncbi:MAG: metalloregulator ArsR/SmtB family transcription factor [Luminiphilus sp.]|jgi:ubiquinone/menaquinone biosynthesis C-methylase UbiE/DNA-binding transcriptional ArsR family regulator|nr:metalloregulator ArsR/SmtB family transcription factor [Luminiphilus sp.]